MYLLDMGRYLFFEKKEKNESRLFIQVHTVWNCKYLLYQSYPYLPIVDLIV